MVSCSNATKKRKKGLPYGSPNLLKIMVARDGVEPPTRGFSVFKIHFVKDYMTL